MARSLSGWVDNANFTNEGDLKLDVWRTTRTSRLPGFCWSYFRSIIKFPNTGYVCKFGAFISIAKYFRQIYIVWRKRCVIDREKSVYRLKINNSANWRRIRFVNILDVANLFRFSGSKYLVTCRQRKDEKKLFLKIVFI